MEITPDATIKEILAAAQIQEKDINVILSCGKTYNGSVKQVGPYHVRLALKGQMSFFVAMIRLEHISVVEVQVRS